jgi:hypothetical protein
VDADGVTVPSPSSPPDTSGTVPTTPTTPTTPPATPAPTPPSGTYPASVVAAGLQSVWNLRTTAGLTSTPTKTPTNSALPPGTTSVFEYGQNDIHITQDASFDGWDFTGYRLIIDGSPTVTFTNTKFAYPNGDAVLDMGTTLDSESPNVTCSHCEFDLHDMVEFYESPIRVYGNTTFTLNDSFLHNASRDYMSVIVTTNGLHASRNFIMSPGKASQVGDHIEAIHIYGGTNYLTQNLFDVTDGAHILGGWTGIFYTEGYHVTAKTIADRNILMGSQAARLLYEMQMGYKDNPGVTAETDLTNNVIERGTSSGYMGNSGGTLIMTGNRDLLTGGSIDTNSLAAAALTSGVYDSLKQFLSDIGQTLAEFLAKL